LCIPHYFNDFCCYQSHITRLLVDQIEAKLIIGYGLIFCIIVSIMMGWDARTIVIWVAIFPGICLVTFADACTFQAMTTRKTLELALIFLAVPFLITVWFGLRNNQQNVETIGWIPTFPIEEVHWVKAENMANGTDQGDFANTTASTLLAESQAKLRATLDQSQLLELALSMLQTNILLLVKTIYNHVMTPGTAMILQLKVQKTEVNVETEDFLESLSDQERRIAHDLIMKHRARRGLKTSGSSWMMTEDGQSSQSSSRSVNPAAAGTFDSNDAV